MSTVSQSTDAAPRTLFGMKTPALSRPVHVEARPGLKRNVGEDERLISLVAGGVLAGAGLGTRGLLSLGLLGVGGALVYRAATGHCSLYDKFNLSTVGDTKGVRPGRGIRVARGVHINKSPEEVSREWGDLTNLPTVMSHLESVEDLGDGRTHWVAKTLGKTVEWDAETTSFVPGKEIRFRSLPGGDIDTEGAVFFEADPNGGTILRTEIRYDPPAGALLHKIASLFGADMESQIDEDLWRFKRRLETGSN